MRPRCSSGCIARSPTRSSARIRGRTLLRPGNLPIVRRHRSACRSVRRARSLPPRTSPRTRSSDTPRCTPGDLRLRTPRRSPGDSPRPRRRGRRCRRRAHCIGRFARWTMDPAVSLPRTRRGSKPRGWRALAPGRAIAAPLPATTASPILQTVKIASARVCAAGCPSLSFERANPRDGISHRARGVACCMSGHPTP